MNFFLTLLVVVIVFNILYHLLKGLPSLLTWFYIKIATLWVCVRGIVYLIQRSRQEEGKTKELTRRPPPYLLRRYAHQWMKNLERDQGWAWCLYVANVPAYYRDCSLEDAYSLPLWVERTISFVASFSLQLLVIYILMLILMPQPTESTPAKLYNHLGIEVASCLLNAEGLCFLLPHEESVGVEKLLEMARRPSSPPINKTATAATLDLLVGGREQRLLYPLEFLGGIVQYVNVENELIPLLMHLDKEERMATGTKKHPCICPLFLNMPGNLSFLYDTSQQEWVVMIRPAICRNNSFAELVLSSVNYNAQSLFFSSPCHIPDELIHYDSFVVEYIDYAVPESTKNLEEPSLFTKVSPLETKQMHIFGDDAVCFVYCDTIKKK